MSPSPLNELTAVMTEYERTLTLVAAIGAGLCAGVFFAFSTFVMPALRTLRPAEGMTAMQAINRAAPNGLFMSVLFGPLIVCGLLVVAVLRRSGAATIYIVIGSVCFLAGLVVLGAYHVPKNNQLDTFDAHSAVADNTWSTYYTGWTAWNHVRTLTFTAAATCFTLALHSD
jgi:uncharacterized membrane protein